MNVVADKLSRILWPVATAKAVQITQHGGKLLIDTDAEEESASESEEYAEECFQAHNLEPGDVLLL